MKIQTIFNYNLQNKKTPNTSNLKNIQTYQNTPGVFSTKISFKGADVNQNQILLLSAECAPYSVSGGLGSVICDMSKAYKKEYPNKDIRIMIPFYNASCKSENPLPIYTVNGVKNNTGDDNLKFQLENTGVETEFRYGVRKSQAKLYKCQKPQNGVTTYFLYLPELKGMKKEYDLDDYSMFEAYCAFSNAAVAILDKMKNSKENFNPAILHTNDWHTTFAAIACKNTHKETKSIHGLLNAHAHFQCRLQPFAAALNCFNEKQIEKLISNNEFKKELMNLIFDNKDILINKKILEETNTQDYGKELNNKKFIMNVLVNVAENYQKLFSDSKNDLTYSCINNVIRKEFKDICWDENNNFNATVNALKNADSWFTISKTHLNELLTQPEFSSLSLYNMMRVKLDKGTSILNKIDEARYDSQNPEQVYKPYNVENVEDGKARNKVFLFQQMTKSNISRKTFDKKIINNPENAIVLGYLDSKYFSYPLAINISRFDTNQKGSDIAMKSIELLLNQNQKINFVLALPGIKTLNPQLLESFEKNVINKYPGRIVLIDAYVPINEYAAAADFSIIPSRSETCGLVGYQSMRMGAIPISAPIGSMNDCLITPYHDIKKAMGFKAPLHFLNCSNPAKVLANTISTAIDFYYDEPQQLSRMKKNCMLYDSSWKPAVKEQNELYENVLNNKTIGKLKINDLKETSEKHNLKILKMTDLPDLPKADVLVLLAHPDDEIFFLPIMKKLEEGKSVQFVYSALGEKGHYKAGAPSTKEELIKHREIELLDALNELGIKRSPIVLDIPDLEFYKDEYAQKISKAYEKILETISPQEVWSFGPDGITGNGDHKITGKIAFDNVRNYNENYNKNIKLFQPALTKSDAQRLKDYSSYTTDAFDFVAPSDVHVPYQQNVSKYKEKLENALNKHKSQWTQNEVKAIRDFYNNTPVKYVSRSQFPEVDAMSNPWKIRKEDFSKKYGQDFEEFNGGISFKPYGLNYKVNLYLADFNTNKNRLWIETSAFKDQIAAPELLSSILKNTGRIISIPQFGDVKTFDVVLYKKENPNKKVKISIPVNEVSNILAFVPTLTENPEKAVMAIKRENPFSRIKLADLY